MAEQEETSYLQSVAEQRLKIMRDQLAQNYTGDSVIGRSLKELQRKDFKAQIQPLYAQVKLTGGVSGGGVGRSRPVGQMYASRSGKTGGVNIGEKRVNGMTLGWNGSGTNSGGTTRYHTGTTTVLDKGAQWTTEGYIDNKDQPREQAKQMVIRSLMKNTGTIFNRKIDKKTGEEIWDTGQKVEFGPNGNLTPIVPMPQKQKSQNILAEQFKKRREQATSAVATLPPAK